MVGFISFWGNKNVSNGQNVSFKEPCFISVHVWHVQLRLPLICDGRLPTCLQEPAGLPPKPTPPRSKGLTFWRPNGEPKRPKARLWATKQMGYYGYLTATAAQPKPHTGSVSPCSERGKREHGRGRMVWRTGHSSEATR